MEREPRRARRYVSLDNLLLLPSLSSSLVPLENSSARCSTAR